MPLLKKDVQFINLLKTLKENNMKIYNFEQRTEDWYKVRLGKLTGSDFYTFMGKSETRKRRIIEKATERITGLPSDVEKYESADMQRGRMLEDEAILVYEMIKGVNVEKVGFVEYNDYAGCSPDGLVGEDGIIECKAPKNSVFVKQVVTGEIDPVYYAQMQYNLFITERKWCDYIAYNVNFEPYIVRFEKDKEYQGKIVESLERSISEIDEVVNKYKERIKK